MLISICIPSYNRPKELRRLLESVDTQRYDDVEIVVCEDKAPKQAEVRMQVEEFAKTSKYKVVYHENEVNQGYDRNQKVMYQTAHGEFVILMGDDDVFIPGRLDGFIDYIEQNRDCGYFLRCYQNVLRDGSVRVFQYFDKNRRFDASVETYVSMFDKSVFVSGFTVKRELALKVETDYFDGSLLYQLYVLAEVCQFYPSAYYHTPITQAMEEDTIPYFGNSEAEKKLYTPGKANITSSVNFMKWYVKMVDYEAEKYHNDSNQTIKHNMSKYSYAFLVSQADKDRKTFWKYFKELKDMGFGTSVYFYLYFVGLYLFGENFCSTIIYGIKKILGRRPAL